MIRTLPKTRQFIWALLVCACSQEPSGTGDLAGNTNENGVTSSPAVSARAGQGAAGKASASAAGSSAAQAATAVRPGAPSMAGAGAVGAAGQISSGAGAAGAAGNAPKPAAAGSGGSEVARELAPLDCGPDGIAIENAGPPKNRINYVVLGDGYTREQVSTFKEHMDFAMKKRFSEVIGQPYGRYRKFVNICAIPLPSENGPIGSGATPLNCSGDDQSRLARCDTNKANAEIKARLPASFEVDWKAVVLNNDRWWNTGAVLMLWSGGHEDADGAALHEGGHGFHQLADEYDGSESNCGREFEEVNSTADAMSTGGKWDMWLGYEQSGATGIQTALEGSRYCRSGQFRPSDNSMMNMLFGDKPDTAYNAVSREKMIMDIWRAVTPIDETRPPAGDAADATVLEVVVIDPDVISVDWSVDGEVVAAKGGTRFDLAAQKLPSGSHTVSAKAYDNAGMDLVRYTTGTKYGRMNWARSQQTVAWKVAVP